MGIFGSSQDDIDFASDVQVAAMKVTERLRDSEQYALDVSAEGDAVLKTLKREFQYGGRFVGSVTHGNTVTLVFERTKQETNWNWNDDADFY